MTTKTTEEKWEKRVIEILRGENLPNQSLEGETRTIGEIMDDIQEKTIIAFIRQELQEQKQELTEKIQWELSDILIMERKTGSHMDIAKYIKRLDKLKNALLTSEEEKTR